MAGRANSTSRRTLLAAPVVPDRMPPTGVAAALAPVVAAADALSLPAVPGACFELGRQVERSIREYQKADQEDGASAGRDDHWRRMRELSGEIDALQSRILRTRAVTALDVLAKLLVANVAIDRAANNEKALESCEQAEDAVRDCIIAIADLTGASLIELGADWTDHLLCVRLEPELRRVLPKIYAA